MTNIINWFDLYVKAGLRPIPVFNNTKVPIDDNRQDKWNEKWSSSRWRPFFLNNQSINIGLLLGDIIDVEGDSKEANDLLIKLIGDIPHPTFKSSKSIHHLFKNPLPNINRFVYGKIEYRAYGHHSVVPPSTHESGSSYEWLNHNRLVFPELPKQLIDFYEQNKKEKYKTKPKDKCKLNHCKTECKICKQYFYIHKKRLFLEVKAFQELGVLWSCRKCRKNDIRDLCRKVRQNL